MEVSVEKPGSPEEVLAHFGKKGMKWGVRNASKSDAALKPTTAKSTKTSSTASASRGSKFVDKSARMKKAFVQKMPLSVGQKKAIGIVVFTGASFTATMLAGPAAGMAVSAIGRVADAQIKE